MDIVITEVMDDRWTLTDLLGRSMGYVEKAPDGIHHIIPEAHALETFGTLGKATFTSLDLALSAIETQTRGTCRRFS
jgi:hypothetical protein